MNKSLLIIMCDFLLLSLLSMARFDAGDTSPTPQRVDTARSPETQQDLMDVLKLSLEEERVLREQLNQRLGQAELRLSSREQLLADRDQRIRSAQQLLQQNEEQARRLENERAQLSRQFETTQLNLTALQQQLAATASEATESRKLAEAIQSGMRRREEEARKLQAQLDELERTRQAAEQEKQRLAQQLEVAETEKRLTRAQLENMRGEVEVIREEKVRLHEQTIKLAEGVSSLAEKSGELAQEVSSLTERSGEIVQGVTSLAEKSTELQEEIRQNRPLAPNVIFSEFTTNRVQTMFLASRSGIIGQQVVKQEEPRTILVSDGSQTYAIYHVDDTPFSFGPQPIAWERFSGVLRRGINSLALRGVGFLGIDPRVVIAPVSPTEAKMLGTKVYPLAKEPFKFEEAILVGASEGYYGECKFQIDGEHPQYVRMQRERFSRLFGKFLPSRGDLVFSKSGELIGIMVNKEYCVVLDGFDTIQTLPTGNPVASQVLSQLHARVTRMPAKLQ
jgi:hypothetical protein